MASFPNFSNIQKFVRTTLTKRKGNTEYISKLNPFIRLVSGGGAGLVLVSNPDFKLLQAAGTTYGSSTTAGAVGTTWGGAPVNPNAGQGYKPSPVVTSLEVDEGAGSLSRKANFSITCFTKEQMEKITQYFLEPGFSIFIEWGWSTNAGYGGLQGLSANNISQFNNASNTNKVRESAGGEYDNYLGFITGGGVSLDGDKWTVSVKCTGYTELPTYLLTSETGEQKANQDGTLNSAEPFGLNYIDSENTSLADERFMKMFNDLPQTRQTKAVKSLRGLFAGDITYLINFDNEVTEELNDTSDGWNVAGFNIRQGRMTIDGSKVKLPAGTKITGEERFIRFDAMMNIIYQIGIDGYSLPDGSEILFAVDYLDTACSAFEKIYSTDPSKLFIPNPQSPTFNLSAKPNETVISAIVTDKINNSPKDRVKFPNPSNYNFQPVNGNKITLDPNEWGYLKDLYVNFDFFKSVLDTKNFFIKDALYQILNGISSAVNGIWDFQIEETEVKKSNGKTVQTLKIWEMNCISSGKQIPTYSFNMLGEESIFISSGLEIDISGAKMNQIIGKKLGQKLNSDSSEVTLFESGLTDQLAVKLLRNDNNADGTGGTTTTTEDAKKIAEANLNIMLGKSRFYPRVEISDKSNLDDDLYKICYLGAFKDSNIFSALKNGNAELNQSNTASPLMPVNFSFTIHGVSGIRRGDMFKVIGIPSMYSDGFFQVLSVKHSLQGMQWTTEVTGGYRNNR